MRALTKELANFIINTSSEAIPDEVYEHAKICFLDWLGVAIAGHQEPLAIKLREHAERMGGFEQASLIGSGQKKTVEQAALINGAASHALDFDDSIMTMIGHPSVVLFPGTLALAEWRGANGRDFLTAFIIGLQVASTLGECVGKSHYMKGWHATSTLGHVGAAAAAARLLGFDQQQTLYAIGIAATQSSGLKRMFGTMCKPFHAGNAASNAVTAALLAEAGFTSAEDSIEGRLGFLDVMSSDRNDAAFDQLGKQWCIAEVAQKYHASCHGTHSPIEAALAIFEAEKLSVDDIQSANIVCSDLAVGAAGIFAPQTGLEGKFSINYCVANALLRGNTGMQAFTDEKVLDPTVKSLYEKISIEKASNLGELEAHMSLTTNSGETYLSTADIITDIPPLSVKTEKIGRKVRDICEPILGVEKTAGLIESIQQIDQLDDISTFIKQIKG